MQITTNAKLSPVGRGYSWMGDHLGIASCWFSKNLGTRVSRVVVVGLSRAPRVLSPRVLRFSSLRKINLSLIHLSFTRPPLITVFLHWRGSPCMNIMLLHKSYNIITRSYYRKWSAALQYISLVSLDAPLNVKVYCYSLYHIYIPCKNYNKGFDYC